MLSGEGTQDRSVFPVKLSQSICSGASFPSFWRIWKSRLPRVVVAFKLGDLISKACMTSGASVFTFRTQNKPRTFSIREAEVNGSDLLIKKEWASYQSIDVFSSHSQPGKALIVLLMHNG